MVDVRFTPDVISFLLITPLQAVFVPLPLKRWYTIDLLYLPPIAVLNDVNFHQLVGQLLRLFLVLGDLNGQHSL